MRFVPNEKNNNSLESFEELEILEAFAEAEEFLDYELSDLDLHFYPQD